MADTNSATQAPEPVKEKKQRKRKFPPQKSFPNKLAYLDFMIKWWTDKKADYVKNGDVNKQRTVKKATKMADDIQKLMKSDPEAARIILAAIKAPAPTGTPVQTPPAQVPQGGKRK